MHKLKQITSKILDNTLLQEHCKEWHKSGKKIVFTNGCFDILHHGHIDLLAKAADFGDVLIVGLNSDNSVKRLKGEERPINHEQDRAFQLAALLPVDAVCFFSEDTPEALIKTINPDVLVKGGDYTIDTIVGASHIIENGGRVEIVPFVSGYSTSATIERIKKL
ncbi:MAG: D-glycero-beta-D-manno-heptose 1-phosphate adenylyltransferase [Flavipsychrobacter sp.]